jgi:hypothetical protein
MWRNMFNESAQNLEYADDIDIIRTQKAMKEAFTNLERAV